MNRVIGIDAEYTHGRTFIMKAIKVVTRDVTTEIGVGMHEWM